MKHRFKDLAQVAFCAA